MNTSRESLPFRTEFKQQGRVEGQFRATEEELGLIASMSSSAEMEDVVRWSEHPDERVVAAVLEKVVLSGNLLDIRWLLYSRIVEDARREGSLWTPLLDLLDVSGCWPSYGRFLHLPGRNEVEVVPVEPARVLGDAGIGSWNWSEVLYSSEEWSKARGFRSNSFWRHVAEHQQVWSKEALGICYADKPRFWPVLWNNERDGIAREFVADEVRLSLANPSWGERQENILLLLEQHREIADVLLDRPVVQSLLNVLRQSEAGALAGRLLYRVILERAELNLADLEQLYDYIKRDREASLLAAALAEHNSATPDLWVRLLKERGEAMERSLAEHSEARACPEVREILLKSKSHLVGRRMLREARESEVLELSRRWASLEPKLVLAALAKLPEEALKSREIDADILHPLLNHQNPDIRLAAIRLLGLRAT